MVSAWPEPPSVIPAELSAGATAGAITERKGATEPASIHHKSDASSVGRLRSELAPAVAPADGSAGLPDGGSGHADTINSGSKWAASQANLRDHAIRLRNWRGRHCLRRRCEG